MTTSSTDFECLMAEEIKYACCSSSYIRDDMCMKACFIQIQIISKLSIKTSPSTPIPRLSIDQSHPLKHPPLCFLPVPTPGLCIAPSLQVYPIPSPSLTHSTAIELPTLDALRIPSQIPLERRPGRPPRHRTTHSPPRTDNDIDPAVHVGILGVGVGFQIGGLGRPVRVLPDDEGFVLCISLGQFFPFRGGARVLPICLNKEIWAGEVRTRVSKP